MEAFNMDVRAVVSAWAPQPASDAALSSQTEPAAARPAAAADPGKAGPGALTSTISRLLGHAHGSQPAPLSVSYRVEHSEIVTVFSDPKTGKEVAQFPPELIVQMAVFFDKHNGVTLDRNA